MCVKLPNVLPAALVAIVLVAVIGWWAASSGEQSGASSAIAHVHGLGINPADGDLYVATHHGIFRVDDDEGEATPVSAEPHDFMGFTVAGADHFLASGHPSPGSAELGPSGGPPLLGLIESRDGGRSWTSLSLLGEADFHGLTAAHGRVYGYDSTGSRLMVSADGEVWDTAPLQPVADIAVDPADPERLVVTTAGGPTFSTNGGETWDLPAGPPVLFVDWHPERGLWGLDAEGVVHRHLDGAWQRQAQLTGRPEALLLHDEGLFAALNDGATTIHQSVDGQNWDPLLEQQP